MELPLSIHRVHQEAKPYPWPWATGPRWVEAPSVFIQGMVERHLTEKELCQLIDLRFDWVSILSEVLDWNEGNSPPLQILVEFIASARPAIRSVGEAKDNNVGSTDYIEKQIDWGCHRAPWLGHKAQYSELERFEHLAYFGWVWDHSDFLDITVACKGDDAQVNLKLWAVGGDLEKMENVRVVLRNFLWRYWLQKITKEANDWLSTEHYQVEEHTRHQNAIKDCLEQCEKSDWWQWEHGSRLFFWRWPSIWRNEARDGSPGFHYKYPRPQLKFPQVPIHDKWVIEKD
jgi:hypothetical protein